MKRFHISEAGDRGWFIGDFDKAVYRSSDFEVSYQEHPRSKTDSHIHNEITEIVLVIEGSILINGEILGAGNGAVLYPGEAGQMEYLEQTKILAIKTPSRPKDKQLL